MSVSNLSAVLLVSVVAFTAACSGGPGDASLGSTRAPVMAGGACTSSVDCASGLECESEVEGGVTTSVCKAHGGDDGTVAIGDDPADDKGAKGGSVDDDGGASTATGPCPAGTEPELEHGVQTCKPHASVDAGTSVTPSGTTPAGGVCASSADCATGLECEVQVEDGGTRATCQPHGGKGKGA